MILAENIKSEIIDAISEDIYNCKKCTLYKSRNKIVPGCGNINPEIVCIGEAPGRSEDETGEPFVGTSGKLLDEILELAGISRELVFITNIIKCRPPNNRDPERSEIKSCSYFLERQLKVLSPKAIITLGRPASQTFLETKEKISSLRGNIFQKNGYIVMPTFHPAFILHSRNAEQKKMAKQNMIEDISKVIKYSNIYTSNDNLPNN